MSATTNEIKGQKFNAWIVFLRQLKNPLLLVFMIATVVAFVLGQKTEAIAIWIIMTVSILLGFFNEFQAEHIIQDLVKKISFTVKVARGGNVMVIPVKDVLVGDEITLHTGSIVPADIKLSLSEELEVNESVLTGESLPVIKRDGDIVYMGTVVSGGNAHGKVVFIGTDTKFGKISESATKARPETEFQKGLRDFSILLARIAVVTVVIVIAFGLFLHHSTVETILFALTVAMGITPELLPLIVTISLSYGAKKLARESVVVKQFISIEDLGNMEVLCTDKTGTLTEGKIHLTAFQDARGAQNNDILELGLICNSGFTHGHSATDTIDRAIMNYASENNISIKGDPKKIYEIPFNFENRFMSMAVNVDGKTKVICKGSPEAILARCNITPAEKKKIEKQVTDIQKDGLRVIAVAERQIAGFDIKLIKTEFNDLKFMGLLSFADIPKKDLGEVFKKFESLGVAIKIITGDSEVVAEKISREVGFNYKNVLTSSEIALLNDEELSKKAWETDIFAKVTPSQKMRIIEALKKGRHTIGYLGDGINDAPALHVADIGISVNTAVDVAKDAASVVLLHKSLGVIADGIKEGRRTFQNTIKYILMGTSSDFGNMVSAAAASIVLPFLPMTSAQILLNNILYDISQTAIPSDNVDNELILQPRNWDIAYIKKFMLVFGPIGTFYDFLTFAVMYYVFDARNSLFQTGWFVTSFVTQVLVVFVIRTKRIPFFKSRPSTVFLITCLSMVVLALWLPYSPVAWYFDFTRLPPLYFVFFIILSVTYLLFVELGKYFLNNHANRSAKS